MHDNLASSNLTGRLWVISIAVFLSQVEVVFERQPDPSAEKSTLSSEYLHVRACPIVATAVHNLFML